jgi:hypothetical protein
MGNSENPMWYVSGVGEYRVKPPNSISTSEYVNLEIEK